MALRLVARLEALVGHVLNGGANLPAYDEEDRERGAVQQIVRCIASLLVCADCRQALAACNGAPVIVASVAAARPGCDDLPAAVARALTNLTFDGEMAAQAVHAGGLPPLIAMLSSGSTRLELEAASAILNISAAPITDQALPPQAGGVGTMHAEALIQHGVLAPLVTLLHRDDNATLQEQAALARSHATSPQYPANRLNLPAISPATP